MGTDVPPAESTFHYGVAPQAALYALIDAAREPAGPYEAEQAGVEYLSLFAGEMGQMLKDVAPHLVDFRRGTSFYSWWFQQWGNSIGVLVEAPVSLTDLRKHFRTLTIVKGESDQKKYYFRFYDPRVLRVFLPSCTPDEIGQFFGPITAFYCEGEKGELLLFTRSDTGVSIIPTPVRTAPVLNERSLR